jgi:hypothetical protein
LDDGNLFAANSCDQILIPFEFNVPPVLPRALVGVREDLSDSPLLLLHAEMLKNLPLILDGLLDEARQLQGVKLGVLVLLDCQRFLEFFLRYATRCGVRIVEVRTDGH